MPELDSVLSITDLIIQEVVEGVYIPSHDPNSDETGHSI